MIAQPAMHHCTAPLEPACFGMPALVMRCVSAGCPAITYGNRIGPLAGSLHPTEPKTIDLVARWRAEAARQHGVLPAGWSTAAPCPTLCPCERRLGFDARLHGLGRRCHDCPKRGPVLSNGLQPCAAVIRREHGVAVETCGRPWPCREHNGS